MKLICFRKRHDFFERIQSWKMFWRMHVWDFSLKPLFRAPYSPTGGTTSSWIPTFPGNSQSQVKVGIFPTWKLGISHFPLPLKTAIWNSAFHHTACLVEFSLFKPRKCWEQKQLDLSAVCELLAVVTLVFKVCEELVKGDCSVCFKQRRRERSVPNITDRISQSSTSAPNRRLSHTASQTNRFRTKSPAGGLAWL